MIGMVVQEPTAALAVARIKQAEDAGVPAVWMTIGGAGGADPMATFAAAGAQTGSVLMGTAIVPNMPRHPIIMAQQAIAVAQLAPGRFRLGIGPSHQTTMENTFGFSFNKPLTRLGEYLDIVSALLTDRPGRRGRRILYGPHTHPNRPRRPAHGVRPPLGLLRVLRRPRHPRPLVGVPRSLPSRLRPARDAARRRARGPRDAAAHRARPRLPQRRPRRRPVTPSGRSSPTTPEPPSTSACSPTPASPRPPKAPGATP